MLFVIFGDVCCLLSDFLFFFVFLFSNERNYGKFNIVLLFLIVLLDFDFYLPPLRRKHQLLGRWIGKMNRLTAIKMAGTAPDIYLGYARRNTKIIFSSILFLK